MDNEQFWTGFAAGAATAVGVFLIFGVGFWIFRPWIRMKMSGGRGSLIQILGMRLRGNQPMLVVEAYTSLIHSGAKVSLMEVESQYVANRAQIATSSDLTEFVREHKQSELTSLDGRKGDKRG